MLSDCKPGDWVKLYTEENITKLGKIIEICSEGRFNGYYSIEWYARNSGKQAEDKQHLNLDFEKHFNNKCNYLTLIDNLLAEDFSSYCYNRIIEKIILVQS